MEKIAKQLIETSKVHYTSIPYDTKINFEDKKQAFKLGAHDFYNNTSFKVKPDEETLSKFASLLEPYYGRLTKYQMWFEPVINMWRVVIGN